MASLHPQSASEPVLETRGLTINFGGHVAVNQVSCAFHAGTLTSIVGPNGAGKTTWFNLISGQLAASAGSVHLFDQDITALGAAARADKGLGRAFQLTNLFPNLTALENVRLAVASRYRIGHVFWQMASRRRDISDRAAAYLEQVNLGKRADTPVANLPHGDQRKLEVALMLALEPEVFMFDEPTAGMSVDEVPVILDLIADIKNKQNKVILLVEHKMDVVRSLSDRIVVLHNGELVADGEPSEVIASPIVQEAYLGTPQEDTAGEEG
ncbi:MAG: ABC transporter ATP-binding protein [Alloalcanivorax venustensis]|mgnify:FL=1|jgi:branched-chain amino acid transport system ATP-binding protein|uniref:ABC transporter ATP-binding protein n=1 Tax=Alloalcanivorax venustensis TaxID=172371 RepID=UPI00079B8D15|nr:MAG: ABC transporter ATP-binding protein [Alcanivorax sp. Nap_24]MAQ34232.1 ABC transporter ATP-binding protein [Alcanivorax sp.]MBT76242.1 ABC transporter ATP-binding protein [Alcanivorax sp.]HAD45521.1 ABC transporter ATP-binding protein [Alcanivorax sp.]HAI34482.1 ABC transporter ATP-binding protein [Alcanivorax sp.]|tara:strand:+ start:884 stop:1687 length:804 start_codon:yes stop_codon:yes gene_type:complete